MERDRDVFSSLTRRQFAQLAGGLGAVAGLSAATPGWARIAGIRRFEQTAPFPVNAYIVEGEDGIVVIDATLTETASRALRAAVDETGKPLRAALLTHPHPDHYAGLGNLTAGLDVPVIAVAGVNEVVRRDDAAKDALIGAMFGDEWPANRVFPTQIVKDGDTLDFGPGLTFEVMDIGPGESFHDSVFFLRGEREAAFAGDLAYSLMHPYMADNRNEEWSRVLERLHSELPETMVLHVGHGAPVTPGILEWQKTYLDLFEQAIMETDWSDAQAAVEVVTMRMQSYLPSEDLLFLMQLSIESNAKRLGKI